MLYKIEGILAKKKEKGKFMGPSHRSAVDLGP
jgi:hypothetical protein